MNMSNYNFHLHVIHHLPDKKANMSVTREVGPLMQKLRGVLLGRSNMNGLRFPQVTKLFGKFDENI